MADDIVVHAYGLVRTGISISLPRGIDGAAVTLVDVGRCAALVSELSTEALGEEQWRAHEEDPRWLQHVATEHHAVLQAVVDQTDVLPLRLPAIYHDTGALRRVLREQQPELEAALESVRGHVEMGAKIFLVGPTAKTETQERPLSGRDYLARRSAEAATREQARVRRQQLVLAVHEQLAHGSTGNTATRRRRPPCPVGRSRCSSMPRICWLADGSTTSSRSQSS